MDKVQKHNSFKTEYWLVETEGIRTLQACRKQNVNSENRSVHIRMSWTQLCHKEIWMWSPAPRKQNEDLNTGLRHTDSRDEYRLILSTLSRGIQTSRKKKLENEYSPVANRNKSWMHACRKENEEVKGGLSQAECRSWNQARSKQNTEDEYRSVAYRKTS